MSNGLECKARNTRCHGCGKIGHFMRMCLSGTKTGANGNSELKITTTPAQDRFRQKQMRKKINNKPINNLNSASESEGENGEESDKQFGDIFENSDSEEEFKNEIFQLINKHFDQRKNNRNKTKKVDKKELREINTLMEV